MSINITTPLNTLTNAVVHWAERTFARKSDAATKTDFTELREATERAQSTADAATVTFVNVTYSGNNLYEADMTIADIKALVDSGKTVVAVVQDKDGGEPSRVPITWTGLTAQQRDRVYGTAVVNDSLVILNGDRFSNADNWTMYPINLGLGGLTIDGYEVVIETWHEDGATISLRGDEGSSTLAKESSLASLATRVDALEGAGGGVKVVTFSGSAANGVTASMTYAEMAAAFSAGECLVGNMNGIQLQCWGDSGGVVFVKWGMGTDGTIFLMQVIVGTDDAVTMRQYSVSATQLA